MAFLEYAFVLILYFVFMTFLILAYKFKIQRTVIPTNWPIFGMIPSVIVNIHRLHDYITEILAHSGGTFMFKGPWFTNMDMLFTMDPLDNHHLLSKNYKNYPKGENFRKIFDVMGNGILTSDGELWEMSHRVYMHVFNHAEFQTSLETIVWNKLESGLLPILESISGNGIEMDLQDIFQRFTFDTICMLLFDNDPRSLCLDFPCTPCVQALREVEEAMLLRHITPPSLWKLQQLLRVGKENKLINATKTLDHFIYKSIDQKQNEYNNTEHQEKKFIFITTFMTAFKNHNSTSLNPTKFLRDSILSLMAAGKDTISSALSWFFYLLSRNPIVEDKILKEIRSHLEVKVGERWHVKELDEMTYFHGALCESLRLFPSIPLNHKSPFQPDILPSGHQVFPNTTIILSYYSMGRMKSIWGEDCMEFKPERWILKNGGIKREPSYKFASFGSGPRACVGKNMALSHLKIVSIMIIYHYHIELVECHPVLPQDSIVLQMKYGLKVRLTKRSELNKNLSCNLS